VKVGAASPKEESEAPAKPVAGKLKMNLGMLNNMLAKGGGMMMGGPPPRMAAPSPVEVDPTEKTSGSDDDEEDDEDLRLLIHLTKDRPKSVHTRLPTHVKYSDIVKLHDETFPSAK